MTKKQAEILLQYIDARIIEMINNENGWTRDYRYANQRDELKQAFLDSLTD